MDIVFGVIIVGLIVVIAVLLQRSRVDSSSGSVELIKADVTELNRTIMKLSESMGDRLERNNTAIQTTVQKQLA